MFGIRRLLRQILERLTQLEGVAASATEKNAQSAEHLAQRVSELSGAANRHDMAIEDMLESWEELQEQAQAERTTLISALTESAQRERQESLAREKALLSLVISAHDRLFELQRTAEEAGAELWLRQLVLAQQKLEEARLPAGFQTVEQSGVPLNFTVHEASGIVPTQDAAQDRLVAEIDAPGYLYKGQVLRKARVSVWRLTESEGESI